MRITKIIRGRIVNELIDRAFKDREKALLKKEHDLALRLYRQQYPEEFERQCDALNDKWVEMGNRYKFTNTASTLYCYYESKSRVLALAHKRPAIENGSVSYQMKGNPLKEELEAFFAERDSLDTEIKKRRAEAMAVLEKAQTLKTLNKRWPEVVPIAEKVMEQAGLDVPKQVIVLATDDLNSAFDLPVEGKELENA